MGSWISKLASRVKDSAKQTFDEAKVSTVNMLGKIPVSMPKWTRRIGFKRRAGDETKPFQSRIWTVSETKSDGEAYRSKIDQNLPGSANSELDFKQERMLSPFNRLKKPVAALIITLLALIVFYYALSGSKTDLTSKSSQIPVPQLEPQKQPIPPTGPQAGPTDSQTPAKKIGIQASDKTGHTSATIAPKPSKNWGKILCVVSETRVYSRRSKASPLPTFLKTGEKVRIDFCEHKWCAVFPISQTKRDLSLALGYVPETLLRECAKSPPVKQPGKTPKKTTSKG